MTPFDKTITAYIRVATASGYRWQKKVIRGAYTSSEYRQQVLGNELRYINARNAIIPSGISVDLHVGDLIADGICNISLPDNDSGNILKKSGAWTVKTVMDNRYNNSGVGHVYVSEV